MPKKIQVLYTPFEGEKKKIYSTVSDACDDLGLNYSTIAVKFKRHADAGKVPTHLFEAGKLEAL